jgi:hypothetical protein
MRAILSNIAAPQEPTRRAWFAGFGSALLTLQLPAAAAQIRMTQTNMQLGDAEVQLVTSQGGPNGMSYLSLHENESTGVAAARVMLNRFGGRLVELRSRHQRLLTFSVEGNGYVVDPNRVFTDIGIDKSLRLNGRYSLAAHHAVVRFRDSLVAGIFTPDAGSILAIHNNAVGGLSINRYAIGGTLEREAARVAINPKLDAHDFFLSVDNSLFQRLSTGGSNVVLQSLTPTDDGSMSVYCQRRGVAYVNIEAAFGHLHEQTQMLELVVRAINR